MTNLYHRLMRQLTLAALLLLPCLALASIDPTSIAVIYNSNIPESKQLAEYYAQQRNVPSQNLIGLPLSNQEKISFDEYTRTLRDPLIEHFNEKSWWSLKQEGQHTVATSNKIKVILTVRGVPYGIQKALKPEDKKPQTYTSCVDSALAALGVQGRVFGQPMPNPYYDKKTPFAKANISYVMLPARLDGPSYAIAKRLIDDAISTEQSGLWGMAYLDFSLKGGGYQQGDDWLAAIQKQLWGFGIPTVVENTADTYVTNYPMRDTAIYYGWYTTHANGPFLNPDFKFKKGAIAVHLHSFSAHKLHQSREYWSGTLLEKNACATVGNVYEPYLHLTHHFDILQDRLLKGYTFVEAASMAMPAFAWQNIVIGDPLYRPYKHLGKFSGKVYQSDKFYRANAFAFREWLSDPEKLTTKLRSAGLKYNEPRYYETLGLFHHQTGNPAVAQAFYRSATKQYLLEYDKIRNTHHIIALYRQLKKQKEALDITNQAISQLGESPDRLSLIAIRNILSPPAPPQAKPVKGNPAPAPAKK